MDALVHALETAVTKKRSPLSQLFSREAFRLCLEALPQVLGNPADLDARGRMLLGAAYAGTAIENSMLGCAHSAANPLTAHFGVVHGQAVGRLIPGVILRNLADAEAALEYGVLARASGLDSVEALVERIREVSQLAGLGASLGALGVTADAIPQMAQEAAAQWTASFNPVAFTVSDFESLYLEALT
jgi:alcohol dehydrogenase